MCSVLPMFNCSLFRYNKDGTIGLRIRGLEDLPSKDEISTKEKEAEEALAGDLVH